MAAGSLMKHLPNAITVARLGSVPVLLALARYEKETAFAVLLFVALGSDVVDGWLARTLRVVSPAGAMLDSIADALLMLTIGFGIWVFHPIVYFEYGAFVWSVICLWGLEHVLALIRYRRPSSFHTQLVRFGVGLFGLFLLMLFTVGFNPWLFFATWIVAVLAVFEQMAMMWILPQWTPNLRGGIFAALRHRRQMSDQPPEGAGDRPIPGDRSTPGGD
jgi:phosphatidylglycerophosphate synthase